MLYMDGLFVYVVRYHNGDDTHIWLTEIFGFEPSRARRT